MARVLQVCVSSNTTSFLYVYEVPCGHALAYNVAIFVCISKRIFIKAHFSACTFILGEGMANIQIIFEDFPQNKENSCSCS